MILLFIFVLKLFVLLIFIFAETTEVELNDLTENIIHLFINEDAGSNTAATDD